LVEKIKGQGHRTSKRTIAAYLAFIFTYRRRIKRRRLRRQLQTSVVGHNLLSSPEMHDSWVDGHISCQHSVLTSCSVLYYCGCCCVSRIHVQLSVKQLIRQFKHLVQSVTSEAQGVPKKQNPTFNFAITSASVHQF